jgi:PTS system nitrogen regulatory IIA component
MDATAKLQKTTPSHYALQLLIAGRVDISPNRSDDYGMLLKLDEVARLFDVTEKDVLQWIRKEGLPATLIDDQFQVNRMDLLEWATGKRIPVPPHFPVGAGARADLAALPTLRAALEAGGIHYDVPGDDKESALRNVVALLPLPVGVDPNFILDVLLGRESLGATALGNGIAIPHVRHPILVHMATPAVTLCFLRKPIEFGAPDGLPVGILFTLTTPTVRTHLHLLSRLAQALREPAFKAALAIPGNAEGILSALPD